MNRMQRWALAAIVVLSTADGAMAGHPWRPTEPPLTVRFPKPTQSFGFPGSTYRWGWFGANYYPRVVGHAGYYGRDMQLSYRRGY